MENYEKLSDFRIEYLTESQMNEEFFSTLLGMGLRKAVHAIQDTDTDFSNMLRYIKKGEYGSAVKLANKKKLTSETEFKNVVVFNSFSKKFDSIKGGMACLGASTVKATTIDQITDGVEKVFETLFLEGGFGDEKVFNQTCGSADTYKDCISFILTKNGRSVPKYTWSNDLALIRFFNEIRSLSNGTYVVKAYPLIKMLVMNGFKKTIDFLCEHSMIELRDGVDSLLKGANSDILSTIKKKAPHNFKLHEPEIKRDSNGKIIDGDFCQPFKNLGYDLKGGNDQSVLLDNVYRIIEQISTAFRSYTYAEEKISDDPINSIFSGVAKQINDLRNRRVKKENSVAVIDDATAERYVALIQNGITFSVKSLMNRLKLPTIVVDYSGFQKLDINSKIDILAKTFGNFGNLY
jgi:hypothetical protein